MGEPIMWGGDDPYTHMLCVGPTRCGKTATILTPMAYQLLLQKKAGKKVGFSIIEPKGDFVRDVKEFCDEMEIPYVYIDPEHSDSHRFNVMEGDTDDVAEATVAVLQSLFGKQEAFFQTVQELSTRNVTKLLKTLKGDDLDLMDLLETLRDEKILQKRVGELRQLDPNSELLPFFENELLGSLSDQYRKLVIGLRAQLENITGNQKLRKIITGKSDINLDEHLENGGVLLVNTSLGTLKNAGDAFGMFVTMHLQSATFRRKGTEKTRTPHFLIVDEYSRYINPDVEMFLSIAASYRVAGVFATQSLGQLEIEAGKISAKAMKQAILTSCRNKIAFCGLSAQDAQEFADEFGKDKVVMRQSTYKNRILFPNLFPENYRDTETEEYRYHYTYLQDNMKRFHFLTRILKDGTPQRPFEGVGQFVPRDWAERREWENGGRKIRRNITQKLPERVVSLLGFKFDKQQKTREQSLGETKLDFDKELEVNEDEALEFEKQKEIAVEDQETVLEYTPLNETSFDEEAALLKVFDEIESVVDELELKVIDDSNVNEVNDNDNSPFEEIELPEKQSDPGMKKKDVPIQVEINKSVINESKEKPKEQERVTIGNMGEQHNLDNFF